MKINGDEVMLAIFFFLVESAVTFGTSPGRSAAEIRPRPRAGREGGREATSAAGGLENGCRM